MATHCKNWVCWNMFMEYEEMGCRLRGTVLISLKFKETSNLWISCEWMGFPLLEVKRRFWELLFLMRWYSQRLLLRFWRLDPNWFNRTWLGGSEGDCWCNMLRKLGLTSNLRWVRRVNSYATVLGFWLFGFLLQIRKGLNYLNRFPPYHWIPFHEPVRLGSDKWI